MGVCRALLYQKSGMTRPESPVCKFEDMVSFGIGAMVEVPCSVQATVESAQLGVYLAMDGIGKQRIAVHKVKTERFGVLVVQYGVSYEEQVDDVSDFQSGYGQLVPFSWMLWLRGWPPSSVSMYSCGAVS